MLLYRLMDEFRNLARLLGSNGGKKTLEKYGKDHFKEMSIKAIEAKKQAKKADSNLPIDSERSEV